MGYHARVVETWLEYVGGEDKQAAEKVSEALGCVADLNDPWQLVDAVCEQENYHMGLWEEAAPYLKGYVIYIGEDNDIWKDEFSEGQSMSQFDGWIQFSDGTTGLKS